MVGSVNLFDDKWLDKEENSKLMDFLFKFLKPVCPKPSSPACARHLPSVRASVPPTQGHPFSLRPWYRFSASPRRLPVS